MEFFNQRSRLINHCDVVILTNYTKETVKLKGLGFYYFLEWE